MRCKQCDSESRRSFPCEIAIHFVGREAIQKPAVLVFPDLLACFNCGFTEFTIPERELNMLAEGKAITDANVFEET